MAADDDDAWARFSVGEADPGPRTEPVRRIDPDEIGAPSGEEDAYLTELRKAMLEDTGAPVDDDLGDDVGPRSRFGRRR